MNKKLKTRLSFLLVIAMLINTLPVTAVGVFAAGEITITKSGGWFETAYIEFAPVAEADGYNVYVKSSESSSYTQIDDLLIRRYPDYFRADAVGLKKGSYDMKVAPVYNKTENTAMASEVKGINVEAYDRSGFAFSDGVVPGAYDENGVLKPNAKVLYITPNTVNTATLDVSIDSKGKTETGQGLQNILTLIKKGYETNPICIRLIGKVGIPATTDKGDIVIDTKNAQKTSITFEGIGEDATIYGWGIRVKYTNNLEVRNLGFMLTQSGEGDCLSFQQNNAYLWAHNNDFFYGEAGSDADQVKGDGSLDTKISRNVTNSYNHFWDSGKCNLVGLKAGEDLNNLTFHHNWFDHSDSRHPRIRVANVHVYNNYYDGNSKYGIGATMGSSVFSENNYFRNCKYPMLASMQGSDIINGPGNGTFSSENGGMIKAFGNYIEGAKSFLTQNDNSSLGFDVIVTTSPKEPVPNTYVTKQGGTAYNNFDTAQGMYEYKVDTPEDARTKAMQYAGRMNGGDLKWTFNNSVDDSSSELISELKNSLSNYTSKIVYIGSYLPDPSISVLENNLKGMILNYPILDAKVIFALADGKYIDTIDPTKFTVSNLPAGLTALPAVRVNDTTVEVPITGAPTEAATSITTIASIPANQLVKAYEDIKIAKASVPISVITTTPKYIRNFTTSPVTEADEYFTIVGSAQSKPAATTYKGTPLTAGLKFDSSASISFSATQNFDLTVVAIPDVNILLPGNTKETTYTAQKIDDATPNVIILENQPAGDYKISKKTTAVVYYVEVALRIAPAPTPSSTINFEKGRLDELEKGGIYSFNDASGVQILSDSYDIPSNWYGTTLKILKKGDAVLTTDSLAQTIAIPARPAAPVGLSSTTPGTITGVNSNMQYKLSTDSSWIDCTGSTITGLASGTYNVRIAATSSTFASASANIVVEVSGEASTEQTSESTTKATESTTESTTKATESTTQSTTKATESTTSKPAPEPTTQTTTESPAQVALKEKAAAVNAVQAKKAPSYTKDTREPFLAALADVEAAAKNPAVTMTVANSLIEVLNTSISNLLDIFTDVPGDIDGEPGISADDVMMVIENVLLGASYELNDSQSAMAKVSDDGKEEITINDIIMIMMAALGQIELSAHK